MLIDTLKIELGIRCIDEASEILLFNKNPVLLGMSPFNSYYSRERLEKTVHWVYENFPDFYVFLGDEMSCYNFLSLGYELNRAKRKTKDEDNRIRNRVLRVFEDLQIPAERLLRFGIIKDTEKYQSLRKYYHSILHEDPRFLEQLRQQLAHLQLFSSSKMVDQTLALHYFFDELPFLLNGAELLNLPGMVFVYHQIPGFIDYLFRKIKIQAKHQGFMTLNVDELGF